MRRPRRSRSGTRSSPATLRPGHVPEHHREHRPVLRAHRRVPAVRAAAVPRLLPDHPGLGHPARAGQAEALRRAHVPGRGRDRRRRRGAGRRVRRRPRRHHHVGTGHPAQGRDDRPGRLARAAADRVRHPARRARPPACRPRPSRPTCCRPCSAATASRRCRWSPRPVAVRLLQRRDRGRPAGGQVPHAGHPAVGRLPGQRLRAVAHPGRRDAARPDPDVSSPPPRLA